MRTVFRLALALSLPVALSACSSGGGSSGSAGPSSKEQLAMSDLQNLQNVDVAALTAYDQANNHVVSEIFGGTTSADVMSYLNARVHYCADVSSLHVTPADYGQLFDPAKHPEFVQPLTQDQGTVIALNVGMELWLDALANGQTVQFTIDGVLGTPTNLVNTRTGLVILAGGYVDRITLDDGSVGIIPPIFREVTLIHEARHSDCQGGISQQDLAKIKAATTQDEFVMALHLCGHSHVNCPSGPYKDLPACDNESWGAYQVGSIFAAAAVSEDADAKLWNVAKALSQDSASRVLVNVSGTPDMSSAGAVP